MADGPNQLAAAWRIRIPVPEWSGILVEASRGRGLLETGGILLSRESPKGRVIDIDVAGGPGPNAKHGQRSFSRDLAHAKQLADQAWRETGAIWVGEWHTHPVGPPVPSATDVASYARHLADADLGFDRFISIVVACRAGRPASAAGWLVDGSGATGVNIEVVARR